MKTHDPSHDHQATSAPWTAVHSLQKSEQKHVMHKDILWMEEILHHLGWLKPWDKPPISWCRISSIHRRFNWFNPKQIGI